MKKLILIIVLTIIIFTACRTISKEQVSVLEAVPLVTPTVGVKTPISSDTLSPTNAPSPTNTKSPTNTIIPNLVPLQDDCGVQISKLRANYSHFDLSKYSNGVVSFDKKILYVRTSEGEIISYQTDTLQELDYFYAGDIFLIGISPDGKIAVEKLDDDRIVLRNPLAENQDIEITIPEYNGEWIDVAFSPSGNEIAATWGHCEYGKKVAVWDINTGELIWIKHHGFCGASGIAYSPDGKKIATGVAYSRTLYLFDSQNGDVQEIYSEARVEHGSSVVFSPSGKILAFGLEPDGEGTPSAPVAVISMPSGKPLHVFDGKRYGAKSLSISSDNELIAAGTIDGSIILWNITTGNRLCTMDVDASYEHLSHYNYYYPVDVFFVGADTLITVQPDGIVSLWKIDL